MSFWAFSLYSNLKQQQKQKTKQQQKQKTKQTTTKQTDKCPLHFWNCLVPIDVLHSGSSQGVCTVDRMLKCKDLHSFKKLIKTALYNLKYTSKELTCLVPVKINFCMNFVSNFSQYFYEAFLFSFAG